MIFLISFENPLDGFLVLSLPQGFELQMDFSRIKKNQSYSKLKVTSQEHFQYFDFDGVFFVRLVICNLLIFCLPFTFLLYCSRFLFYPFLLFITVDQSEILQLYFWHCLRTLCLVVCICCGLEYSESLLKD